MKPAIHSKPWEQLSAQALHPVSEKLKSNTVSASNIELDYSSQCISPTSFASLLDLANVVDLKAKINALISGNKVNISENRPALHTALRSSAEKTITVDQHNVMLDVIQTRKTIQQLSETIRNKQWFGYTGKPIKHIVNIGIGGSDLGPRFCLKAFADLASPDFSYHFISDVDPNSFKNAVASLHQEETLFIIASKSFTTEETLYNARKAFAWLGDPQRIAKHCIAVTANAEKAQQFGIKTILPIWDWVGGRYSFCSAINFITAIALGFEVFNQILKGAHEMDNHFQQAEFRNNLPVLLALFGIWNNNFLNRESLLILTYAQELEQFVPYIQQLDMESNGKSIDNAGNPVHYATGPIVWGGLGNQAQHSYYQLLCQGTHKVAADFITTKTFDGQLINQMCFDKIRVLTSGVNEKEHPNGYIPGNLPLNHIQIKDCSPYTIGSLIALYEHKVFVQSVIWNINPFDQPGVESAKRGRHKERVVTEIA